MVAFRRIAVQVAWVAVSMALLAPGVVSYARYRTRWDDLYFLHRAVSLHRAVWNLDARQWAETFSLIAKSPLMALLAAPWGPASRTPESVVALTLVSLALLNWGLILACLYVLSRMGVSPWLVLAAAVTVFLDPLATRWTGVFLADVPVGWASLLLLLLIPYEALSEAPTYLDSAWRGVLWGAVASVGLLAKVTFWPVLLLVSPVVIGLRWWRVGWRAAALSLAVGLAVASPALAIVIHYHRQLLDFALGSAVGGVAKFYASPAMSYGSVLLSYWEAMGSARFAALGLLAVAAASFVSRRGRGLAPVAYSLALLIAYFALISANPVREMRYFLPVVFGLPFLLAVAGSRTRSVRASHDWIVFAGAWTCASVVCWPMGSAIDLGPAREARALLELCRGSGLSTVVLATDSSEWNIETLRMARELMGGTASGIRVETLAYSTVAGLPISRDFDAIENSDVVIFESPTPVEPDAINTRAAPYREFTAGHGERMEWPNPTGFHVEVFRVIRPVK